MATNGNTLETRIAEKFTKKLAELNNRQDVVETLSLWMLGHRSHAEKMAKITLDYAKKSTENIMLAIYLTNDVTQRANKYNWEDFRREYGKVIGPMFDLSKAKCSKKEISAIERILRLWDDRGVFSVIALKPLLGNYGMKTRVNDLNPRPLEDLDNSIHKLVVPIREIYEKLVQLDHDDPRLLGDSEMAAESEVLLLMQPKIHEVILNLKLMTENMSKHSQSLETMAEALHGLLDWTSI